MRQPNLLIAFSPKFVLHCHFSTTISKRHRKSGAVCLWRRSRRFRPRRRPSGTIGAQIYILRQTSALMAKLPSSCPGDTPQSRCPSNFYVAVRGANLRATLYQATRFFTFPFWQPLRALHPCAQVYLFSLSQFVVHFEDDIALDHSRSPSGQVKCIIFCARIVPRRQPKRRKNPLNFKKNALNRG